MTQQAIEKSSFQYAFCYLVLEYDGVGEHSLLRLHISTNKQLTYQEYHNLHVEKKEVIKEYGDVIATRSIPVSNDVYDSLKKNGIKTDSKNMKLVRRIPTIVLLLFFWFVISFFFHFSLTTRETETAFIVKEIVSIMAAIGLTNLFKDR